jgi:peptidoglycan hydrolase CwlO-like protein
MAFGGKVYPLTLSKDLEVTMSDQGIIKPLRQRIKDLEVINLAHQKKNGQLRVEIQDKDKKIKELEEQIKNPTKKLREVGQL